MDLLHGFCVPYFDRTVPSDSDQSSSHIVVAKIDDIVLVGANEHLEGASFELK